MEIAQYSILYFRKLQLEQSDSIVFLMFDIVFVLLSIVESL